jgi:AAA domain
MRAGELVGLAAPRGIGKSLWADQTAILLDRGEGLLGGRLPVRSRARTLIAVGEVDEWESYFRWERLTEGQGLPSGVAETFDRWRIRIKRRRSYTGADYDEWSDAELDDRIETAIDEHKFNALEIDPWAVYYAGNENDNDATEAALDKLRALAMRHHITIVILHHPSKAIDFREPEDVWRGASRLADWCSTRVTVLPHYTPTQAAKQGMTRAQARRYVDVYFLRRSTPTEDFSMVLDQHTLWWNRWHPPEEEAQTRRLTIEPADIAEACRAAGGSWPSTAAAAIALGCGREAATKRLHAAERDGLIERFVGRNKGDGWRLPLAPPTLTDETP